MEETQPAIATRINEADNDDIETARQWFRAYDGPKTAGCDPQSGCFSARVGFNLPSGEGARGLSVAVESFRESDTILGVYLIATGVKHIDELASRARLYVDFSTIEGRLEVISVHEHNSLFIWETLTNNRVECFVSDEQIKEAALLLNKRVTVSGRINYRNHVPKTISVEGPIKVLRTSTELPQPKDIGPIDITGGVSSEQHVRRMRNG
jgi:hypothetical protein